MNLVASAAVVAVVAVLSNACSSPTGPTPATNPATGTWAGTIVDEQFGQGTVRFVIDDPGNGFSIQGTWAATFPNPANSASGPMSAPLGINPFLFTLTWPSRPNALLTATVEGTRMTGTYLIFNSGAFISGSINLVKQ